MSDQNSVVQIIVQVGGGAAYTHMAAGTGWFPDTTQNNVPEGTMLTNAHVIRNAKDIFIRIPAAHKEDIRAHVHGVSSDLDLAVLYFRPAELSRVKSILKERYGDSTIPTLKLANSDLVHPKLYINPTRSAIYARGYPLGNEFQTTTSGIVSGIKHARNQVYYTTTATINGGNSGGPAVNQKGEVVGINSMKLVSRGVEEVNMIIPSNRIAKNLPELMENSENINLVHNALAKLLFKKALMKAGQPTVNSQQLQRVNELMEPIKDVDYTIVVSNWNQHNVGGFKKGKDGIVSPVSMSDWFMKHVDGNHGGHSLFEEVFNSLHKGDIDRVHEMRKTGFGNFYCLDCSDELDMKCGDKAKHLMDNIIVPPKTLHMPEIGFEYSHGTGKPTLEYYGNPKGVKSGVIISSLYPCSICSVLLNDLLYSVGGNVVDNYGEVWMSDLGVSLNIIDVLSRCGWNDSLKLSVVSSVGEFCEREFIYKANSVPNPIRFLDSVVDVQMHSREMLVVRGVGVKTLRMDDVLHYKINRYSGASCHHLFRIMVCDIDSRSVAFQAKSIRPGSILKTINGMQIPQSWEGFTKLLQAQAEDKPLRLSTEDNKIIII